MPSIRLTVVVPPSGMMAGLAEMVVVGAALLMMNVSAALVEA
jgi:hypothetical protein